MNTPTTDFEKAYSAYYAEIRRFIFTIARRDPDITDDISQNVWQSAYRYFGTLRDKSALRSWLYAIARNEAKRYFANRHAVFFANALPIDGDEDSDGIDIADEDESGFPERLADSDLLASLLASLKEDEQGLILLYYAYDVDLKEIADMSGTNYNTLKSSFRRTMEKLRRAAKEMEAQIR